MEGCARVHCGGVYFGIDADVKFACPFCACMASNNKRQQMHGRSFWVQCCGCGARGPRVQSKIEAIEGWNRRELAPLPYDEQRHVEAVWPADGTALKIAQD